MRALLLSLLTGLFLLPAYAQKRIFLRSYEKELDSVRHYQRLLIVGEGGMQARMYMDNLSAELIKEFKSRHIECKYEYLGDHHKVDTDLILKKAEAWPHDAVLRFSPLTAFERDATRLNNFEPYTSNVQQFLVNDFDVTLNEGTRTIWYARLETTIEFGKLTVYKRIRKVILDDLEKQNVLPH